MHISVNVENSETYFSKIGKEIDWEDSGDPEKISLEQEAMIQEIITLGIAHHTLRGVTGVDQLQSDTIASIRSKLIVKYEAQFEKYTEYNEIY